jgi:hypothetical protein
MFGLDCPNQKKEAKNRHSKRVLVQALNGSVTSQPGDRHSYTLPRANHRATYLFHGGNSSVLRLNPSDGSLMLRDYGLHGSQPSLSASQRRLGSGKASSALAQHRFRCRDKAGSVTGNLLDCGQRPAGKATDVILVPDRKMIADEEGEDAHRHPIACFFEHHKTLLFRLLRPLCELDEASRNSLSTMLMLCTVTCSEEFPIKTAAQMPQRLVKPPGQLCI